MSTNSHTNEKIVNGLALDNAKYNIDLPQQNNRESTNTPSPDVGYAWVIVACSFLLHCILLGVQFSYGIFLKEYLRLKFGGITDKSQLSLVGSISISLLALIGVVSGKLADRFGYRIMVCIGSTLFALGLLLASFATELWHLYLTQSLLSGIGSSIAYIPAVSIVSCWFDKKRGLATGIAVSGSGVGGLILSPAIEALISNFGLKNSLRIIAAISFAFCIIAAFFLKLRVPRQTAKLPQYFYSNLLKDPRFWGIWFDGLIQNLGFLVPMFLMPIYCQYYGLSDSTAALMVGILLGCSAIGRIVLGQLADIFGKLNMFILGTFLCALFCLAIWLVAFNFATIILFCILFGLVSGVFSSLMPSLTPDLFGTENIASIIGIAYTSCGIANLSGPPLAAKLIEISENGQFYNPFTPMILFTAFSSLAGVFILLFIKKCHCKSIFTRY